MNARIYFFLFICLLFSGQLTAQIHDTNRGFRIEVQIDHFNDSTLILAHRFGDKFYTDDTVYTSIPGNAVFEADTLLPFGMYQIVLPDKRFLDIFIDEDQHFKLFTDQNDFIQSNQAIGHDMNQLFFDWHRSSLKYRGTPEIEVVWDTTLQRAGNSLLGKFLRGLRPFQVPESIQTDTAWANDQMAQYQYYKTHFFDNLDWCDRAMLRTPVIHNKLSQFFEKVVPPQPDSIIYYAEWLLTQTSCEPQVFRYCLQYLFNYYAEPKIMGTDAVYVHLAQKYYLTGQANWIDESNLGIIRDRVRELEHLLVGKPAPVLPALETPEGEFIRVHESDAKWRLLYFWEPDCGHCKKSTPELHQLYPKIKELGGEIYAINTRLDKEPWISFIAEHELSWINLATTAVHIKELLEAYQTFSTPKLFIINNEGIIVAKDLVANQVVGFLEYLNKQ